MIIYKKKISKKCLYCKNLEHVCQYGISNRFYETFHTEFYCPVSKKKMTETEITLHFPFLTGLKNRFSNHNSEQLPF